MKFTRVISIDSASGKVSTVFDGKRFCEYPPTKLAGYRRKIRTVPLICWNAPLTAPGDPQR